MLPAASLFAIHSGSSQYGKERRFVFAFHAARPC